MEVLEIQNILVTISGKKNKIRVYYLSWLKSKILKNEGVSTCHSKTDSLQLQDVIKKKMKTLVHLTRLLTDELTSQSCELFTE